MEDPAAGASWNCSMAAGRDPTGRHRQKGSLRLVRAPGSVAIDLGRSADLEPVVVVDRAGFEASWAVRGNTCARPAAPRPFHPGGRPVASSAAPVAPNPPVLATCFQ